MAVTTVAAQRIEEQELLENAQSPDCHVSVALRPGVRLLTDPSTGELQLAHSSLWRRSEFLGKRPSGDRLVLGLLAQGRVTPTELRSQMEENDTDVDSLLDLLERGGWLTTTVGMDGRDLYTIQPLEAMAKPASAVEEPWVLSRFAVLHREGDSVIAESPQGAARIEMHAPDPLVWMLNLDGTDKTAGGYASPRLPTRTTADFARAGLLVREDPDPSSDNIALWGTHELWFHVRSRTGNGGYSDTGFGRTAWSKDSTLGVVSSVRRPVPDDAVRLPDPNCAERSGTDESLFSILDRRRSIRAHDEAEPIQLADLAEVLYRTARVQEEFEVDGVDYLRKPYPSGGSVYELELYPVVRSCQGLERGVYRYDSLRHRLVPVAPYSYEVNEILSTAAVSAGVRRLPQVLIVITANFSRLMRTYEQISYSVILKNVGALYHSLYLVTTSFGLAGCGLGAGDSERFARATGLDWRTEEGSVGEFMLGTPAPE